MANARFRIVSDLHVGSPGSRVRHVRQLAPLFAGTDQLVLNGDTLETRFLELDPQSRAHRADFAAMEAAHPGKLTVLTGNHDPNLTTRHHLDLEDGRVLVPHGDILFPELAPWGREAPFIRAEQARRLAALSDTDRRSLEVRLRICKETAFALRGLSSHCPGYARGVWRIAYVLFSELVRAPYILRTWRQTPAQAVALAEAFRPAARFVILGHVHRPGIWHRGGRTIINTGSSVPPLGGLVVDIENHRLLVRRLEFGRDGAAPGPVQRTVSLDD